MEGAACARACACARTHRFLRNELGAKLPPVTRGNRRFSGLILLAAAAAARSGPQREAAAAAHWRRGGGGAACVGDPQRAALDPPRPQPVRRQESCRGGSRQRERARATERRERQQRLCAQSH